MAGKIITAPIQVKSNHLFLKMLDGAIAQRFTDERLLNEFVIVGIDPGETTGFAVYYPWETKRPPDNYTATQVLESGIRLHLQQLETKTVEQGYKALEIAWPLTRLPIIVVCEDYRVYGWKADTHKWAGLHTPQFIGAIKVFCMLRRIPVFFQMAQQAKGWGTEENLKAWNLYETSLKHARDAKRHIINFLFYGGSNTKVRDYLADATKLNWEQDPN